MPIFNDFPFSSFSHASSVLTDSQRSQENCFPLGSLFHDSWFSSAQELFISSRSTLKEQHGYSTNASVPPQSFPDLKPACRAQPQFLPLREPWPSGLGNVAILFYPCSVQWQLLCVCSSLTLFGNDIGPPYKGLQFCIKFLTLTI